MRSAILLYLSVAFIATANAQLSIVPQLGLEASRTAIAINDQKSFSPLGAKLSPQAAVRLNYAFKNLHGPFIGIATSRSIVKYGFSDPEAGMSAYTASRGGTQLRIEGGYQLFSKPIYFKKAPAANRSSGSHYQKSESRTSCGRSLARSSCGSKENIAKAAAKQEDTRTWVRIQPWLGVAYIPGAPRADIYTKSGGAQPAYEYNAGNWTTALMCGGMSLEFGKGAQAKYVVSFSKLTGISNLGTRTATTMVGNKPTTTSLKSNAFSYTLRVGIPISLAKKTAVVKQQAPAKPYNPERKCGQYKMQYKGRCTRVI